jgi:hypothetical protein
VLLDLIGKSTSDFFSGIKIIKCKPDSTSSKIECWKSAQPKFSQQAADLIHRHLGGNLFRPFCQSG